MVPEAPVAAPRGFDAFGAWFSELFRLWSAQPGVWILQGLIVLCAVAIPVVVMYIVLVIFFVVMTAARQSHGSESVGAFFGIYVLMYVLVMLVVSFLAGFLVPGMVRTALKQLRGYPISVGDLFSGLRYGWGMIGLYLLLMLAGMLTCGIGQIVLMGFFYLALPLMVDRNLPLGEALAVSWHTVKTNYWLYLLFALVTSMLAGAGMMIGYIGICATLPFFLIGQAVAYERTYNSGPPDGPAGVDPSHPQAM